MLNQKKKDKQEGVNLLCGKNWVLNLNSMINHCTWKTILNGDGLSTYS